MVSLIPNSSNGRAFPRQSIADLTTEIKPTKGDIPPPLVGAATTSIDDKLYVFGGRVASTRQLTNNLYILNLKTFEWTRHIVSPDSAAPPAPRYFHSASAYRDRYIVVFGGMANEVDRRQRYTMAIEEKLRALDDISIFDLETMVWLQITIPPSIFTPRARYAHLATVWDEHKLIIIGGQDIANQHLQEISIFDLCNKTWIYSGPVNASFDTYRAAAFCPTINSNASTHNGKSASPFWCKSNESTDDDEYSLQETSPVCLYSNYNFNDLTRELQSFYPSEPPSSTMFSNHASEMNGAKLPPGLRFPTGCLMGHYFVISGTYLSSTQKGFQVWALNLTDLSWSHIDTGSMMSSGSWNRGLLSNQKYYILGHSRRDLKDDYSYRRINFDHVAVVDLEAFGIYTSPPLTCSVAAQELGLSMLNEKGLSDLTIWTTDQQSLSANSVILAERWPNFAQLLKEQDSTQFKHVNPKDKKNLLFPETYSVTLAFLQYIYTDNLITAQQHQPQILSRLLVLADMYRLERLRQLSKYALHQLLTISTASMVYETATLTFQSALQIRALRIMINAKRMLSNQQQSIGKNTSSVAGSMTGHSISLYYSGSHSLGEPATPVYQQDWPGPMTPSSSTSTSASNSLTGSTIYSPDEPVPSQSYSSTSSSSLRRLVQPVMASYQSDKTSQRFTHSTSNSSKSSPSTPKSKGFFFDFNYLSSRSLSGGTSH
ncbi:Protein ral2 [Choanephora cucurbitarum]|uniref:Protein ral2 n=1 Tax=Choanephora cucurbitarum TaxID=101091 RepID=A0A1C7NNE7_9FUNG|nr:Protein ral2 [Choanephora cucurbitarum]